MDIKKCTEADITYLARLNKQLIEDEKSDNPMNIFELEERMKNFISTDYDAYYFYVNDNIIGYALVNHSVEPLYLRQFLIDRKYRKQHYGTEAFKSLLEFFGVSKIDIEVLAWNKTGKLFWESCGFKDISHYMRLEV